LARGLLLIEAPRGFRNLRVSLVPRRATTLNQQTG
jgi:hypothetical protein